MIFPSLKNQKFGYVNLNLEAIEFARAQDIDIETENPFLDPSFCEQMVCSVHKKYGVDFSYGGWMEDRSFLWKNGYLEKEQTFIHLGVDINVPPSTEVSACFPGSVARIECDNPLVGGWGTMIIIKHDKEPVYVIYAHLEKEIQCKVGDKIAKGVVFAKVGKAPENGNWFPHLHIQVVKEEVFKKVETEDDWEAFDGYGLAKDVEINAKRFPDPMNYTSLS
jgi:murein DD-endopeptidase MepM/ murein hydrolase activator NlpD